METDQYKQAQRFTFETDLKDLINHHSMENLWDMPDFIMAKLLTDFIYSTEDSMKKNLKWHGVKKYEEVVVKG